jgi:hypothetical protein
MRYILLIIFLILAANAFADNVYLSEIPITISFPDQAKRRPELNLKGSDEEIDAEIERYRNFCRENYYCYKIDYYEISSIETEKQLMMFSSDINKIFEENGSLSESDFIKLLNQDGTYKIFLKDLFAEYEPSYQKFIIDNECIGESYFKFSKEQYLYPTSLLYTLVFIKNGYLIRIMYNFYDIDSKLAPEMETFFTNKRGAWYFKDDPDLFIQIFFNKDESLPAELITFQNDWDKILKSTNLTVLNNEKLLLGILNDSHVRIRKSPNLQSEHIGYLYKDQRVQILEQTENTMKIGNMESVWYKIRAEDRTEGWVYGFFIDIAD